MFIVNMTSACTGHAEITLHKCRQAAQVVSAVFAEAIEAVRPLVDATSVTCLCSFFLGNIWKYDFLLSREKYVSVGRQGVV